MKNIIALISLLFLFSCEDNLSSKTPTFEATVNGNNHWIADSYSAVIQNNQLSISANNQFGAISIFLDSVAIDQYNFYSWTEDFAVFQDTLQYSTQNDGIGSIAYLSDGFLDIHEIDNIIIDQVDYFVKTDKVSKLNPSSIIEIKDNLSFEKIR